MSWTWNKRNNMYKLETVVFTYLPANTAIPTVNSARCTALPNDKVKGKGNCIAVHGTPSHSYRVSLAIWDQSHSVTCHLRQVHTPCLNGTWQIPLHSKGTLLISLRTQEFSWDDMESLVDFGTQTVQKMYHPKKPEKALPWHDLYQREQTYCPKTSPVL